MQRDAQCMMEGLITFPQFYVNTPQDFVISQNICTVLVKLEIAYLEWEDITGYYHPDISIEMLSILKMGNLILYSIKRHIWNCPRVKFGQNWTHLGLSLYYWFSHWKLQIWLHCYQKAEYKLKEAGYFSS